MTAHALLTEEPDANADRIRSALSGNLCRCTGYIPIVEAVLEAPAAYRVRYVGEPVAVVLADSPALAEDGVGAIALDIEELPPVPNRHASERREILLFEDAGTNVAMVFTGVKGDADAAFRDADYVR